MKKTIFNKFKAFIVSILTFLVISCGGGTRGTGDLTIEGKLLDNSGSPVSGALITFTKTGDTSTTNNNGEFRLVTQSIEDDTEFLVETNSLELLSTGDRVTKDVETISVVIRLRNENGDPKISHDVTIKKRRDSRDNNKEREDDRRSNSGEGKNNESHNDSKNNSGKGQNGVNNDDNPDIDDSHDDNSGSDDSQSRGSGSDGDISNDDNSRNGNSGGGLNDVGIDDEQDNSGRNRNRGGSGDDDPDEEDDDNSGSGNV